VVKLPRREADHSPLNIIDVKKSRAISPLPHTSSWHIAYLIKYRANSIILFVFVYEIRINGLGLAGKKRFYIIFFPKTWKVLERTQHVLLGSYNIFFLWLYSPNLGLGLPP
jgi:hypothetical protein